MNNIFLNSILEYKISDIIDFIISENRNIEKFELYYINRFMLLDNFLNISNNKEDKIYFNFNYKLKLPNWVIIILYKINKKDFLNKIVLTNIMEFLKTKHIYTNIKNNKFDKICYF